MPESRARTAICSAPLEWPSRPGLPTRIFGRRPSFSCRRATSSRSSLELVVRRRGGGLADARRAVVAAEHLAQRPRPLPGRRARPCGRDRRVHQVRLRASVVARRHGRAPPALHLDRRLVALGAPAANRLDLLGFERGGPRPGSRPRHRPVSGQTPRTQRSGSGPPPPARPTRSGAGARGGSRPAPPSCRGRPVPRRRARRRQPSPPGPRRASFHEPFHHGRALEDVGVLEDVRFVGEHLLDAQRPLLVPGPRRAPAPRSRRAAGSPVRGRPARA